MTPATLFCSIVAGGVGGIAIFWVVALSAWYFMIRPVFDRIVGGDTL